MQAAITLSQSLAFARLLGSSQWFKEALWCFGIIQDAFTDIADIENEMFSNVPIQSQ